MVGRKRRDARIHSGGKDADEGFGQENILVHKSDHSSAVPSRGEFFPHDGYGRNGEMVRSDLGQPLFGQESYHIFLAPSIRITKTFCDFVEAVT